MQTKTRSGDRSYSPSALVEQRPDTLVRRPSASDGSAVADRRWARAAASENQHGLPGALSSDEVRNWADWWGTLAASRGIGSSVNN